MRGYLAGGLFIVAAAAVSINPAAAASACTGWIDFPGTTRECLDFVLERTRQAGFKPAPSGDTVFFWFGNNVVTTRCISSKDVLAMSAYHSRNNSACPLQDRIRKVLEDNR